MGFPDSPSGGGNEILKTNNLLPLFMKLESLRFLIIGEGNAGAKKLYEILAQSPTASITLINPVINDDVKQVALNHPNVKLLEKAYHSDDINAADVVIVAVTDRKLALAIKLSLIHI